MPERLAFSVRETASLIGCSHVSAYRLIKKGDIRVVNIGQRVLVRREEIARFLAENETPKAAP
jgi:excisionase family DNA binding protein